MVWEKVKLGDIAEFSNGINFDKSSYGKGVKLITVSNFGNHRFPPYSELTEIKEEVVKKNDYLSDGDIIFVRSNGNKELVGRCLLINKPIDKVTYSGFCIRARLLDKNKYNPLYFTYHFKNTEFRRAMSGTAVGANIQNLSQGRLSAYETKIPDIDTQTKIANILSAYDDLIENNQKQIKLLEEAAQRLYKEWFVDFRFPGYESTEFVDALPKGWKKVKLSDFGEIITGKTPSTSKKEYFGGEIPFVKIPDMHNNVYPLKTEMTLTEAGAKSQINKYIPKNSLIVSCIATVGLVNISYKKCQTNQQINSIILNNQNYLYYLYSVLKGLKELLEGVGSNGATMTNVNKVKFGNLMIVAPKEEIVYKFYNICNPIFEKILKMSQQIKYLSEARDRLLPKLMSGEIEISPFS